MRMGVYWEGECSSELSLEQGPVKGEVGGVRAAALELVEVRRESRRSQGVPEMLEGAACGRKQPWARASERRRL